MSKLANKHAIMRTVKSVAPRGEYRHLLATAERESAFDNNAVAKHSADVQGSLLAFERNREKLRQAGNQYVDQPELWASSRGLFQMMPANHIQRWNPAASPTSLFHPVVATFAMARLHNKALRIDPDATPKELRQIMATGSLRHKGGEGWNKRVASMRKRYRRLGFPELVDTPLRHMNLQAFGTGPQKGQFEKFWEISRGLGLPLDPATPPPSHWAVETMPSDPPAPPAVPPAVPTAGMGGKVLIGLGMMGFAGGLAWVATRNR